jgi:hypothetical protein
MLLVIVFSWPDELVPCFGFECWYIHTEFIVEVLSNSRLIDTISCLLALTPIDESHKLYIWISPCPIGGVIWLIMEGECPYYLVFCTRISECSVYRLHSCDLTGECILLESESIPQGLICRGDEIPCTPDCSYIRRGGHEEASSIFLLSLDISCTRSDRAVDTEDLAERGCLFGERSSRYENNTKKHRKIIKKLKTKTHSATQASYCICLTSLRVLYVFLSRPPVITLVR